MSDEMYEELYFQLKSALSLVDSVEWYDRPPFSISIEDVLWAHFMIADFFYKNGEGIGGVGPRDINLLQSTVDRQRVSLGGEWKYSSPYELGATLLFGIVRNHPFFDANKRTGLVSCASLLLRQNIALILSEKELVRFTEDVASHDLRKYPSYRKIIQDGDEDPDVTFVARYLRKHSRVVSNAKRSITFRELITTLRKYGFELVDPKNNSIDVEYTGTGDRRPNLEYEFEIGARVYKMGFPGYSKQVALGDLKRLRTTLYLLPEYGVDSDAFFEDADPLTNLISSYEGVLRQLAFR